MSTPDQVVIGIDVGSTTVKMTVVDPGTKEILWSKYLRHETRQPEMTRDMLREIHDAFPAVTKDGMPREEVPRLKFDPTKLHHVAAKCGVFAETDIVNLVKSGIPRNEIMNSLADAIVSQNLAVLTRGNTLKAKVLLLGGPNTYLPFLQECWRLRIPEAWAERGYEYDKTVPIEELIFVPKNSDLYAAYGAVLFGLYEPETVGRYRGLEPLEEFIQHGRKSKLGESAGPGLVETPEQRDAFVEKYKTPDYSDAVLESGKTYRGVIGLDGGSTSSKCVFIDENENILKKVYTLSKGNPIPVSY